MTEYDDRSNCFDQFFETANASNEKPNSDPSKGKTESNPVGNTECSKLSSDTSEREKGDPSESMDEESSLANSAEEKNNGPTKNDAFYTYLHC
ncbi:hypothetical protein JZ751_027936 [Albula glossodonta]|uniref:Uncharacterized protein n=1 Tax=Albula glossodonta TaxID=121402 RepID=A0A8T2PE74_9TELE|nr:hypothetical protein JZ751_027936 [Albula glossodonta]